jgi:hypothetical protein
MHKILTPLQVLEYVSHGKDHHHVLYRYILRHRIGLVRNPRQGGDPLLVGLTLTLATQGPHCDELLPDRLV